MNAAGKVRDPSGMLLARPYAVRACGDVNCLAPTATDAYRNTLALALAKIRQRKQPFARRQPLFTLATRHTSINLFLQQTHSRGMALAERL